MSRRSWKFYFFSFIVIVIAYQLHLVDFSVPEEFSFLTVDYLKKYGYGYEAYEVESDDGFVTTIFRILPSKSAQTSMKKGPPVLIEGGVFCSSDVMVLTGPGRDIGFILLEAGFDVWLGNYRGTRYSAPGRKANYSDPYLMLYGYHEMGVYDFAASLDYITNKTGEPKVHILAVSVGSASLLALLSTKPEYNNKVGKALHLGGGLALKLEKAPLQLFFVFLWKFPWFAMTLKFLEPFACRSLLMLLSCERIPWMAEGCNKLLNDSTGLPDGYNKTLTAIILTLLPSGTPVGVVDHLMQLSFDESSFRMRDFGVVENERRYNCTSPPLYDLSAVTVPSKAYYAEDDRMVINNVTKKAFKNLPNFLGELTIKPPFCHANFFINSGRSTIFVEDVIRTLST